MLFDKELSFQISRSSPRSPGRGIVGLNIDRCLNMIMLEKKYNLSRLTFYNAAQVETTAKEKGNLKNSHYCIRL